MSTRYVFPELFFAECAPVLIGGKERLSLRWMLHPSLGLPRAIFNVWRFGGEVAFQRTNFQTEEMRPGFLLTWPEGPSAAVQLFITVFSGSATVSAFSGPRATGHIVDQIPLVGPVTGLSVVLKGSPITSVTFSGNMGISGVMIIPVNAFVENPGWKLIEKVGLPASSPTFDGSGYPLDPQGRVGFEVDPIQAAIQRVKEGTPDNGWEPVTDRGVSVEPYVSPDAGVLVENELAPLVEAMAELLKLVANPAEQAEKEIEINTTAPESIHGVIAPQVWQDRAQPSTIRPLASLLLSAGSDPFAALGLGFGTTLDSGGQGGSIASSSSASGIFMITVEHVIETEFFSFSFKLEGELAAFCFGGFVAFPAQPAGLTAQPTTANPRLDPPGVLDGPWLEVAEVSWSVPVISLPSVVRPTGYMIARGFPAEPMEMRAEKRLSGGYDSFIPAASEEAESATSIRFTEAGIPEAFPGDPPTLVYSVAAHDWFGRWTSWISADHPRVSVAPQIPAMRNIQLLPENTSGPVQPASASLEFTWDWSNRSPAQIMVRVLVHDEHLPPPAVNGSILTPGGPTVPDLVCDFTGADIETPPAGVEAVTEESLGNLRTYRVEIEGIQLPLGSIPKIQATARARATERVVPARLSAFSPDVRTTVASPIPPPPPFVPAAMWWASVPDPRGVARTRLQWAATAPLYAVYLADETALRRELDQPSADLEIPAADRLPALRALDFSQARRAFRRVADRVPANSLEIELPRGSKLIHFYGVIPINAAGVEGTLPVSGNDYFAVAAPGIRIPEIPILIARDRGGVVSLLVEVPEFRIQAGRIEIYRAPSRHRAVSTEHAGPPVLIADESTGVRSGSSIRWILEDTDPGPAWQSVFYRAVAYGKTDLIRGEYGGVSPSSPAIEVVPGSPLPPPLSDVQIEDVATEPNHRLVSFDTGVTLARTPYGLHVFAVQTIGQDATVVTRRTAADSLPLIGTTLPTPAEQPDSIFRFDPVNPRSGRTYAWVPKDIRAVVVEITDPAGQTTRETLEAS